MKEVLFNADGNKVIWGRNIGRIVIKCLDCTTGQHIQPAPVKVIGITDDAVERQKRKEWLSWVLSWLTRKRQKFYVNRNTDEVVVVKGNLPGIHGGGGGVFLPGKPKGAKTDNITPHLKTYKKYIKDWNEKNPKRPKRIDKEYVKRLEEIKKKFSGRDVIVISTDAAGYDRESPEKLDDDEKAIILLAALHELKHFEHRGKGYSTPRDEMEVIAWQLSSPEIKKFLKVYIYKRRKLPKVYIPRNEQRMLIEYYLYNWKLASRTDKKQVARKSYNRKIMKMVKKFNKSLKQGEKKIELQKNFIMINIYYNQFTIFNLFAILGKNKIIFYN